MLFLLCFGFCKQGYSQSLYDQVFDDDTSFRHTHDYNIGFNRERLREMALCSCIEHFINDSVKDERDFRLVHDPSFTFLQEMTSYDMPVLNNVNNFVEVFLYQQRMRSTVKSKNRKPKGAMLDCVYLYNSKLLMDFIKQQDKYFLGFRKTKSKGKR